MFQHQAEFVNARAQIQRLSDARFFGGWVEDFDWPKLRLKVETAHRPVMGDSFSARLYGPQKDAAFMAMLMHCTFISGRPRIEGDAKPSLLTLNMHLTSPIELLPPQEPARFAAPQLRATIRLPFRDIDVPVLDISPEGLGVMSPCRFSQAQLIDMRVFSHSKLIECAAQVRYCRKMRGSEGYYRLGLRVEDLSRTDTAYWSRLMNRAA